MTQFALIQDINVETTRQRKHNQLMEDAFQKLFGEDQSKLTFESLVWTIKEAEVSAGAARHAEREWIGQHTGQKQDKSSLEKYLKGQSKDLEMVDKSATPKVGEYVRSKNGVAQVVDIDAQSGQLMIARGGQEALLKINQIGHPQIVRDKQGNKVRVWTLV